MRRVRRLAGWPVGLLVFAAATSVYGMAQRPPDHPYIGLRVAVLENEPRVTLHVKGPYRLQRLYTHEVIREGEGFEETFYPSDSGVLIGKEKTGLVGVRLLPLKEEPVRVNGRRFRGRIDILRQTEATLLVVNHLDLEEYLYGVLQHEVPHDWPREMLEVQAILARTYALYKKMENIDKDYDLSSTVLSQMYGGREEEKRRARAAVNKTLGKVLVYRGTLFPTFYHSTCGGHTEDAVRVKFLKRGLPPLKGRGCPYCTTSPFYRWERGFLYSDLALRLQRAGYNVSGLKKIQSGPTDPSGRVTVLRLLHGGGDLTLPAIDFRLAVGPAELRSTRFRLENGWERVTFVGGGWGHGVGLCQWGAYEMARRGFSVEQILLFYYPGSELRELVKIPWN